MMVCAFSPPYSSPGRRSHAQVPPNGKGRHWRGEGLPDHSEEKVMSGGCQLILQGSALLSSHPISLQVDRV